MRPLLKLKKPLQAPAPQAEKAPAPAGPARQSKPAQSARTALEKEELRLENIRLGAQAAARRRAQMATVAPLVRAYLRGKPVLTTPVVLEGVTYFRPLCVGVNKSIVAWLRAQPEALGCSNTVLKDAISWILAPHVARPSYLAGILKFDERFDLEGHPVGVVSEQDKAHAAKTLIA